MYNEIKNVLVANADNWLGVYAARALLQTKYFKKVRAAVTNKDNELSRALEREGVELWQWDLTQQDSIGKTLNGIQGVILIPSSNLDNSKFMLPLIKALETTQMESVLLWTWANLQLADANCTTWKVEKMGKGKWIWNMYKELEEVFMQSKINNKSIIRNALPMQFLYFFSEYIQTHQRLPLATGHGRFAPIDLKDVGLASATLLSQGLSKKHKNQVYTFTGPELLDVQEIVNAAKLCWRTKVELEEWNMPELNACMDELVKKGQMNEFEQWLVFFEQHFIYEKKMEFKTNDVFSILLKQPKTLQEFFQSTKEAFLPGTTRNVDRWAISL